MSSFARFSALSRALVACAAVALAPASFAATTWNFSAGSGCTEKTNVGTYGNSWSCTGSGSGAPTANATAQSTTGSGSTFATANLAQYSTSGFGVRNQTEGLSVTPPDHSLDNNGQTDVILLNFSAAVSLSQVTIGWMQGDSDISLLRYTGSGTPTVTGGAINTLLSSGWSWVGNYFDLAVGTAKDVNPLALASSWWLISAYNAGYGGSAGGDTTADYIKVLSVAGTALSTPSAKVPEPASLALVAAALVGVGFARRRKQGGSSASNTGALAVA